MPLMPIEKLQPLMVLSEELRDKTGRLLAVKGTVLTKKHFLIFKTWGIKEVAIIDEKRNVPKENFTPDEVMGQITTTIEELKPLFCHTNLEHPFIIELIRLAAQKKVMNNGA